MPGKICLNKQLEENIEDFNNFRGGRFRFKVNLLTNTHIAFYLI